MKNLCLAGGVALNCVGNGRILREGPFEDIWIQPAAGDAGGALGVALFIWHQLLGKPRTAEPGDSQHGSLLGPEFADDEIRAFLDRRGRRLRPRARRRRRCAERVAGEIAEGKVVGWFQGRMEFGPRALGLPQHPRRRPQPDDAVRDEPEGQVPRRVSGRLRRSVLEEHAHEYFDMRPGQDSPYMLLVAPVLESRSACRSRRSWRGVKGIDKLKLRRSTIPAVTHVDYSARVQTVDRRTARPVPATDGSLLRQDRLPGDDQHQLQPGLGPDRLHAARRRTRRSWPRTSTCCAWGTTCSPSRRSRPASAEPAESRRQ